MDIITKWEDIPGYTENQIKDWSLVFRDYQFSEELLDQVVDMYRYFENGNGPCLLTKMLSNHMPEPILDIDDLEMEQCVGTIAIYQPLSKDFYFRNFDILRDDWMHEGLLENRKISWNPDELFDTAKDCHEAIINATKPLVERIYSLEASVDANGYDSFKILLKNGQISNKEILAKGHTHEEYSTILTCSRLDLPLDIIEAIYSDYKDPYYDDYGYLNEPDTNWLYQHTKEILTRTAQQNIYEGFIDHHIDELKDNPEFMNIIASKELSPEFTEKHSDILKNYAPAVKAKSDALTITNLKEAMLDTIRGSNLSFNEKWNAINSLDRVAESITQQLSTKQSKTTTIARK